MVNRSFFQKKLYGALLIIAGLFVLCGTALAAFLYYSKYDSDVGVFISCPALTAYYILSAVLIVGAIVLSFLPVFSCASKSLPGIGGAGILVNSFCGFFLVSYTVIEFMAIMDGGNGIPVWLIVMALCAIIGSLYFLYQTVSSNPNRTTMAIFGMFAVMFAIVNIYAVHYSAQDILLNAPVRVGSLVAMTGVMMFLVNEIRYFLNIANPKAYFAFGILAAFFGISNSLPRIILSVMGKNGFSTGSDTLLLCFQLFVGVYAVVRLASYLGKNAFVDGAVVEESEDLVLDEAETEIYSFDKEEVECDTDGCASSEDGVVESLAEQEVSADENVVLNEVDLVTDNAVIEDQTNSLADDSADIDIVSEQVQKEDEAETLSQTAVDNSAFMSFSSDVYDGNDLPDDSGFEGGNEGEFEVEGFAMVENLSTEIDEDEDSDIDEDAHPFSLLGIDEAEFDNMLASEGEIIDYEELKSSSADVSKLANQTTKPGIVIDDDDDDDVIDMDIMTVLSGEPVLADEEKTKKEEKKSIVQKFKFVKKM